MRAAERAESVRLGGCGVVYSCVRRACKLVAADGCDKTNAEREPKTLASGIKTLAISRTRISLAIRPQSSRRWGQTIATHPHAIVQAQDLLQIAQRDR